MFGAICDRLYDEGHRQTRAAIAKEVSAETNQKPTYQCDELATCPIGREHKCNGVVERRGPRIKPLHKNT